VVDRQAVDIDLIYDVHVVNGFPIWFRQKKEYTVNHDGCPKAKWSVWAKDGKNRWRKCRRCGKFEMEKLRDERKFQMEELRDEPFE